MKRTRKPLFHRLLFSLMAASLAGCAFFTPSKEPPHTVDQVDLEAYMGRWYEIASFPNWFQKGCVCTTADYRMASGYVEVINTCRRNSPESPQDKASAKAFPVEGSGNARLKVQFQWPFKGDYWIIHVDEDYRHAVVGHPKRKYLWILARAPAITSEAFHRLVSVARDKGYPVERLRMTSQSCFENAP